MINAMTRYRELLTQLVMHRELAGGSLPEEIEAQLAEELDRCWWALDAAEQAAIEASLHDRSPPAAPDNLFLRDTTPQRHKPPREAA